MKNLFLIVAILLVTLVLTLVGLAQWPTGTIPPVPPVREAGFNPVKRTMRPFRSEQELAAYFRELAKKQKKIQTRSELMMQEPQLDLDASVAKSAPADTPSLATKNESITNTQEAGVDEGGIVKLHGDHLVVLRRGRLFTVKIGDGSLQPISAVDAFAPDIDPRSTWYDEML
ncbi:MAG TPA: beta-propeller domain-containing protein, partial [Pyrinomonadaceae bacterium]